MRQRVGPSGIFATYSRVHATGLISQTVTGPSTVVSFAGGLLTENLRFVIDGTDLRYIGNPRVLVSVSAFASIVNTDAAPITLALALAVNSVVFEIGPPIESPAAPDLLKSISAGSIVSLVTNDLLGLRLIGPAVTADVSSPQLVISPIGDGEAP